MSDATTAGGGNPLSPALGQRENIVKLLDNAGTVTVKRWSWSKSVKIFKHVSEILDKIKDERVEKLKGMRGYGIAAVALDLMGDSLIDIIKAGLSPEDADKISGDSPAEDVISVFQAMIDINMTEGMTKKVLGLWRRFMASRVKGVNTPSSKPSESSARPA